MALPFKLTQRNLILALVFIVIAVSAADALWIRSLGYVRSMADSNPYILYFSVAPMTEMVFTGFLLGTAFFFLRWMETASLKYLIFFAALSSLAALTRLEGLLLLPLGTVLIIVQLYHWKKPFSTI